MKKIRFEFTVEESKVSAFTNSLKSKLRELAISMYDTMGEDLPNSKEAYIIHYSNLAEMLFVIDGITSFTHFLTLALNGEFQAILDVNDELGFQDFISEI
jgi:hypothetical protein